MDSHNDRRSNETDRRVEDSGLFPIQDHEGKWVVTDRRDHARRHSDMNGPLSMWGGMKALLMLAAFAVLLICWLMIRFGVIPSPDWMPGWVIFPELLIQHLLS